MKCNSENATRQTMFSIALTLTAAGFLFVMLFVPATAMATDADTIERLAFSNGAQAAMTPGAVVPETQAADIPTLKKRPPKSMKNQFRSTTDQTASRINRRVEFKIQPAA